MKPQSAKAKARVLQNLVAEKIRALYPDLEEGDILPAIMGASGEDIKRSPAAKKVFPYSIECKNTERISIWDALNQAEQNCDEKSIPLVIFKRNRSKVYATIELDWFLELLRNE